MYLKKKFIIFLFCSIATLCKAQSQGYLFQRLGVKDGLFEETVHAVQQDAKGFLWLNFRTVIQRYDGHRFLNFYPGAVLPEGNVRAMIIDKKNRLWLLSGEATLGYLDPNTFTYYSIKVNIPKGFSPIVMNMYLNRHDQVMLVWDKQGFITGNAGAGLADEKYNPFILPKGWEPSHIFQDDEDNYWMATAGGLVKYNTAKKLLSYSGHNTENNIAIKTFGDRRSLIGVHTDKHKNIWVASMEGNIFKLHSVNLETGKQIAWDEKISTSNGKAYYAAFGLTETSGNAMWLTGDNIFCRINRDQETVQLIPNTSLQEYSIRYDVIFSIFEDREKNIWLGTNKGLFRFNPQNQLFSVFENKRNDHIPIKAPVTGFLETAHGELLVSTWGKSVFSYDAKLNPSVSSEILRKNIHEMAWCLLQRPNGDIWCSMQDGSISIIEAATKKIKNVQVIQANGKPIRQMAADKAGNIWMGTSQGDLIEWSALTGDFKKLHQFAGLVSRIRIDTQGRVWAGTDRNGLYCINSSTGKIMKHYTTKGEKGETLLYQGAADILQYNDSIFYIAGNGLSVLNTKTNRFQYFTIAKGLHSANITNLLKDKNGFIWMTSGSGIMSYHPAKQKLSLYNAEDGVPNYSFNPGAACVLKNGNIVFGTNRDFLNFNPDELSRRVYHPPKVHITGVDITGEPQNVDSLSRLSVVELNPGQNSFKVFISTLQYKDQYSVHYMLEGIDKTWKEAGKTSTIEYNYLPPGNYVLKVTCFREDRTSGEVTSLPLYIAAPFYRTWWFYTIIALGIGALLFWLDRERIKRKAAVQKMRSDIANNLHQEVNTALQNINILSEMAKLKADKDIDKSKEFIEQIHGKSHTMMVAMGDMLWSIDPANDSMEKTILRMQEFIEAVSNRHGVHISMLMDEKVKKLNLNMQLRHDAFILFRESIRKIVAAGVKDCRVHIAFEKNNILFTVQCNNETCDLQQLNNLLQSTEMEQRVRAIRASLHTEVHKSNTMLMVRVPVSIN